jgi:ABC-type phosphate transport system substrate-binding protein
MIKFFIFIASLCVIQMTNTALAEDNKVVIAIIVASNQNVDELRLAPNQLNLIYWRKQLYWPKGLRIKPVNLSTEHPLRLQFSQSVLGSAPKTQIDYWNGQYFNGVLPPYSVNSEEAVLRYVTQTKGSIGYVNACNIDERVQAVFWIIQNQMSTHAPEHIDCK